MGAGLEEVLHGEAPGAGRLLDLGDDGVSAGAGRQEAAYGFRVSHGGREAYAARVDACHAGEALYEADGLAAAVSAQQGVNLVDDHVAQVAEEARYCGMPVHEQRLEGLRRNLQDARGMLHELGLVTGRDVSVPVPYGNVRACAEASQAIELVVDKGLGGANVDGAHGCRWVLPELRQDGKERGLRLARCGRRTEKDVVVAVEDGVSCGHLDATQRVPAVLVDEVLNKGCVSVKDGHGCSYTRAMAPVAPGTTAASVPATSSSAQRT